MPPVVRHFAERLDDLGWVTDLLVAGSLATGDYVPGVSDLDLVALTGGPVGPAQQEILAGLHRELDQGAAQGLDLGCVYVDAGRLADLGALHPRIPLYFGGASGPALEAGAKNADTYMLWGEPLAGIAERIEQIREVSAKYGRSPRFSISLRPILGETEDEAWARAQEIGDRTEERVKGRDISHPGVRRNESSVGAARLRAFAAEGDVLDERLWMRVARLTGSGGNSTALVGTAEQVADALLTYIHLGISTVLIRGFDPLGDAIDYGRELIPRLREATKDLEPHKELAVP